MSFPLFGETFTFRQPDGSLLVVRGWGDQRQAVFETLDGYTVTLNPDSGFYEYAKLNDAGTRLLGTGLRPGVSDPAQVGIDNGIRLSRVLSKTQAEQGVGLPTPRWQVRREQRKAVQQMTYGENVLPAPPARQSVGDYLGLCLLIQFPDLPGEITRDQVDAFCNEHQYSGFGNSGSVYDYFFDSSLGKLRYKTIVAPYYTAQHPRDHYTDANVPYGQRARELIQEALAYHKAQGIDFGRLTVDDGNYVFATNVFYAGERVNGWSQGLWPHASRLSTPFQLAPGVNAYDYQITDIGDALALGTYCHENGHMLCDFPDLYDYGAPGVRSSGIGAYCLMCGGGNADKKNPTQICAYLKYQAGWANSVTQLTSGLAGLAPAGTNDFFIHAKNSGEYFILENRFKAGRDAALPGSGLAIWHIDEQGNNSNEQMTPNSHYECSLEQSDGRFDLERGASNGDPRDLFYGGWKDAFSGLTSPSSHWWDGTASGLTVRDIGPAGPEITFVADVATPG